MFGLKDIFCKVKQNSKTGFKPGVKGNKY